MRRRKPTVVLWGGRPGIDRQFGSEYDLLHAKLCLDFAQYANAVRQIILPAFRGIGHAFSSASLSLERFSKAQRKVGKG